MGDINWVEILKAPPPPYKEIDAWGRLEESAPELRVEVVAEAVGLVEEVIAVKEGSY